MCRCSVRRHQHLSKQRARECLADERDSLAVSAVGSGEATPGNNRLAECRKILGSDDDSTRSGCVVWLAKRVFRAPDRLPIHDLAETKRPHGDGARFLHGGEPAKFGLQAFDDLSRRERGAVLPIGQRQVDERHTVGGEIPSSIRDNLANVVSAIAASATTTTAVAD